MGCWAQPVPSEACVAVGAGRAGKSMLRGFRGSEERYRHLPCLSRGMLWQLELYYKGTPGRFAVTGEQRAAHCHSAMASTEEQYPEVPVGARLEWGLLC